MYNIKYAFTGSGFTVQGYLSLVHFQQYYTWMNLLHPEFATSNRNCKQTWLLSGHKRSSVDGRLCYESNLEP